MDLRKNRTADELSFEIRRTEEALAFFDGAGSITVSAATYDEEGQKRKMKRKLSREIGKTVSSVLSCRIDALRAEFEKEKRRDEYLALVKQAGLAINAETAKVHRAYVNYLDPYGVEGEALPPEYWDCYTNLYFFCSPGSDLWVEFDDLPDATRRALLKRTEFDDFSDAHKEALLKRPKGS